MSTTSSESILNRRVLPFAFFGNALEFYEFTIYAIFAPLFAKEFFVTDSETVSLIISWGGFAVAFFTRPLGAFMFGYIGDKLGRKVALSFSILAMACATLTIGLLPTYHTAGIFAPISLICLRLIQGLSTGGEYNGAAIYLIEKFNYKRPGFIGGLGMASVVVGSLTGTIFGKWCYSHDAWRLAFLMGGIFGMILFFLRFMVTESLVFNTKTKSISESSKLPVRLYVSKFLSNVMIAGFNGSFSYTLFGFSILYLQRYAGYSQADAFTFNIAGMAMFLLSNPFWGLLYDKLTGRTYWHVMAIYNCLMVIAVFYMINMNEYLYTFIGMMILGTQTGSIAGPSHAFFQEGIDPEIRYRFVSVSCSVGMAFIGGITPAVLTYIMETYKTVYAPIYWIGIIGVLTWITVRVMYRMWEKAGRSVSYKV